MGSGGYGAIVLGLGGMGSAAAYHLARRGQRVLGLDAFERGHARGASHGRSRIIRQAYHEAPEYVPLVRRAYELWRELEAESGQPGLLNVVGGLLVGAPDGEIVAGAVRSAQLHGLPYEVLAPAETARRFPGFRLPDDLVAVLEPAAGFLRPEECVGAHLDLARRHGADLRHEEPALRWAADGAGVRVETARGAYTADRLVVAAGPWAGEVLADLRLPLQVERIVNAHFEPERPAWFGPDRCPIFIFDVQGGIYGVPALPGEGVKVGIHHGVPCTPATIRREVAPAEVDALRQALDRFLPGAAGRLLWAFTCMYTNTPDRHFIIDRHPRHPQVAIACGFSGHGYKFASVVGEILADLTLDGTTRHPIGFLSRQRPALTPTLSQGERG